MSGNNPPNNLNKLLGKVKTSGNKNKLSNYILNPKIKVDKTLNNVKSAIISLLPDENINFLKFNAMYFKNSTEYASYTKKYYEVYTAYMMLLSTADEIKKYMDVHRDDLMDFFTISENLHLIDVFEVKSNPNIGTEIENYFNSFRHTPDITKIFKGNSTQSTKEKIQSTQEKIQTSFDKYSKNSGLVGIGNVSQQTLFEQLISRIQNRDVKNILSQLMNDYNMFKHKIIRTLTSTDGTFNYGLLAFGFLFANEYFCPLKEDVTNQFTNRQLYDLGTTYVDIEVEAKKLNTLILNMGNEMIRKMTYFGEGTYQGNVIYEVLKEAFELDLCGVRFALHYVHPKYLTLFLKRKEKIDKQLFAYLSSYKISAPSAEYKDISIHQEFLEGNGLFYDFNSNFP